VILRSPDLPCESLPGFGAARAENVVRDVDPRAPRRPTAAVWVRDWSPEMDGITATIWASQTTLPLGPPDPPQPRRTVNLGELAPSVALSAGAGTPR